MIRIDRKRAKAPPELAVDGAACLAGHRRTPPRKSDDFDRKVYGSMSVKKALFEMQHEKCCYCEKSCECEYEDVEHFRPKTEAIRARGVKAPGYWWLAYSFENLLFACRQCNATKSSKFPLAPGARALVPEEDPRTTPEQALLLDPTRDRPEDHLTFKRLPKKGYQVAPRNASERGKKTIEVLGLDRDSLTRRRLKYYKKHLKSLIARFKRARANGDSACIRECRGEARELIKADAEFSLFTRTILAEKGLLRARGPTRKRKVSRKRAPVTRKRARPR